MAKRIGANARLNIESQRQRNKVKRGDTLKKMSGYWKWILVICLLVASSAILGYGINRSQWMQNYKAEKNKYKVEWASLADQLWSEWSYEQVNEVRVVAALYLNDQWMELNSEGKLKPWQGPLYKIPVVHMGHQMRLDELAKFLVKLEIDLPETYQRLSEVYLVDNDMDVVLEGIVPRILLRIDRQPEEHLKTVEKFVKKFPAEVVHAHRLDARFAGFIYASKDEK